jgi:hypothetical protein
LSSFFQSKTEVYLFVFSLELCKENVNSLISFSICFYLELMFLRCFERQSFLEFIGKSNFDGFFLELNLQFVNVIVEIIEKSCTDETIEILNEFSSK